MAREDILLILKGGALCAAFSFIGLFIPILGALTNYFALLPIFYVGLCLGVSASLLSAAIPMIFGLVLFGPVAQIVFGILLFAPCIGILYMHTLKRDAFIFSPKDILHWFSLGFLGLILLAFFYISASKTEIFMVSVLRQIVTSLAKVSPQLESAIEFLPGLFCLMWMLMVWLNFRIAHQIVLRTNKSLRAPDTKDNIFLPPVWDIIFVGGLFFHLGNNIFIHSGFLKVLFSTIVLIAGFPLFIDGLETAQIIAKYHKVPSVIISISIILTIFLVWPIIFVVVLGLMESIYGLKKKYYLKF